MGITRVANVTGLDCIGIPVVMVVPAQRALALSLPGQRVGARRRRGLRPDGGDRALPRRAHHPPLKLATSGTSSGSATVWSTSPLLPRLSVEPFHGDLPHALDRGARPASGRASVWVPFETVHTDFTLAAAVGERLRSR